MSNDALRRFDERRARRRQLEAENGDLARVVAQTVAQEVRAVLGGRDGLPAPPAVGEGASVRRALGQDGGETAELVRELRRTLGERGRGVGAETLAALVEAMPPGVAGPGVVGLKDTGDAKIDPATNQRLQAVVDAINEMTVNVDVGTVQLDPNESNYVTPVASQLVEQGLAFIAGQSHATSNTASWTLSNPAGSGVTVVISEVRAWTDANETMQVTITEDATNAGDLRTPRNANLDSANTAAAELRSGVGVLSGGTEWGTRPFLTRRAPYRFRGRLRLPPGKSLSVSMTGVAALSSSQMSVSGQWVEIPL